MFGATSSFFVLVQTLESEYGISPFVKENIEIHANIMNDLIFKQFERKTSNSKFNIHTANDFKRF
tara:strand:- start:209 stop:403 length:195 start_codon:yes stop_codon:yes gene_type:complete